MGRILFVLFAWASSVYASEPVIANNLGYEHGLAVALDPVIRELQNSYFGAHLETGARAQFQAQSRLHVLESTLDNVRAAMVVIGPGLTRSLRPSGFEGVATYLARRDHRLPPVRNADGQLNTEFQEQVETTNLVTTYALDYYHEWLMLAQVEYFNNRFALGLAEGLILSFHILNEQTEVPVDVGFFAADRSWTYRLTAIATLSQLMEREIHRKRITSPTLITGFESAVAKIQNATEAIKEGQLELGDAEVKEMADNLGASLEEFLVPFRLRVEASCETVISGGK